MQIKKLFNKTGAEIYAIAKIKPIIFLSILFSIGYGLATSIISIAELSFYIGITGSYSLIIGITKFYAIRKYRLTLTLENPSAAKQAEKSCVQTIFICTSIMSFLHFSFALVSTFFYEENPSNYDLRFILFIASMTFISVLLNAIQAIRTKKNHSIIIHHLKLADAAKTLISLALLQRAILYFAGEAHAKIASGIGGLFFSLCAGLICLIMFMSKKQLIKKTKKIEPN